VKVINDAFDKKYYLEAKEFDFLEKTMVRHKDEINHSG
jgi:hypothetical protein